MKKYIPFLIALFLIIPLLADSGDFYKVARVIDGDTIELENGGKVRLIGVDTPETVHPNKPVEYFGKEASEFSKKLLEGETVKL